MNGAIPILALVFVLVGGLILIVSVSTTPTQSSTSLPVLTPNEAIEYSENGFLVDNPAGMELKWRE
jgi:hypothetical protein